MVIHYLFNSKQQNTHIVEQHAGHTFSLQSIGKNICPVMKHKIREHITSWGLLAVLYNIIMDFQPHLYMPNRYSTSISLSEALLSHGTLFTGTAVKNRK